MWSTSQRAALFLFMKLKLEERNLKPGKWKMDLSNLKNPLIFVKLSEVEVK
jgi:hypothetical protein